MSEDQEFIEIDPSCKNPAPCRFLFTEVPTVNVPSTNESNKEDILIFFQQFFTNDMVTLIVNETNKYAKRFIESKILLTFSRAKKWVETNLSKMYLFLTIIVLQSHVHKPLVEWY